jgi:RecQ family ATP-dependent DNA helicase
MPKGRLSPYFEVLSNPLSIYSNPEPSPGLGYTEKKRSIQDRIQAVMDLQHQAISNGHRTEVNPWLDMVGWAGHLQGYEKHRKELRALLEVPSTGSDQGDVQNQAADRPHRQKRQSQQSAAVEASEGVEQLFSFEEQMLKVICDNFDEVIRVGQHTVMEKVNWSVRFEINKKEQAKAERRPFHARLLDSTMARYRHVWKQLICYIIRSTLQQQREEILEQGSSVLEKPDDSFPRQPRFEFTQQQRFSYDKMWQCCRSSLESVHDNVHTSPEAATSDTLQPLQQTILRFLISLLDHQIRGNEFESGILSGLAVLGLDPDNGWVNALNYTPILSAVVKIARILVVQYAWETGGKSVLVDQTASCFKSVQRSVHRFMVIDQPVPMSRIYHIRTYGLKIRYSTTADGCVDWTGQGQQSQLSCNGIEFTKEQFQAMVRGVLYDCRRNLMEDILLLRKEEDQTILPSIMWDELRDNPSCDTLGWNFTHDKRNSWPETHSEWWLWERIHQGPDLRRQFLQNHEQTGPQPFRKGALKEWFLGLRRFKELLLFLVFICGGQPPRGSEILSVKHSNTIRSQRNFFVEDGMIVYVTEYHKGYSINGSTKIIHRYLPREVGELFVYYMWLVLPFEQQIAVEELQAQQLSPFMWPLDNADTARDHHTWHVENLTKILQCESARYMGQLGRFGTASYRHCAIALSRRFCGEQALQANGGDEEEQEEDETTWYNGDDAARDLQAGHGTHVAGMIYARGIYEALGVVASMRAQFRQESQKWHTHVLGFKPHLYDSIIRNRVHAICTDQANKRQRQSYLAMKSVNLPLQLQRLLGPGARFRGPQERALQAIMNQEDPVICVMGTGGGKSLLFMLPAFSQSDNTTVVVVPTISLREDMIQRCKDNGITYHEWKDTPPAGLVQIIFVIPESTLSNRFQRYLNLLRRDGCLARVVVDECHVVLDGTLTFRPVLQELGSLLRYSVQMVYLTATLPPEDEPTLFELLQIDPYRTRVMRSSTSRANIRYQIQEHDGTDSSIIAFIQQELERCRAISGRMIVYCNRISRVDQLATALRCPAYHSHLSAEAKSDAYRRLRAGDIDMIVATNGLGVGIDVPNIYAVIHTEMPHKLRDYSQESGRAGRDGTVSTATILRPAAETAIVDWRARPSHNRPMLISNGGEIHMQMFARGDSCRRVILDAYLDGQITRCRIRIQCEEDEALCDVCEQRQARIQEAQRMEARQHAEQEARQRRRQDWQEQVMRAGMAQEVAVTDIESMLAHWHDKCSVCYVRQEAEINHSLEQCRRTEQEDVWAETQRLVKTIKYANYSACFDCGVPQAICAQFKPHPKLAGLFQRRREEGHCQYANTVIPTVAAIIAEGRPEWRETIFAWMEADRVDYENDRDAVTKWFGKKIRWGGIEMCMLMKVFYTFGRLARSR